MTDNTTKDWIQEIHEFGPDFEARAAQHDREASFVAENYATLKQRGFFAAMVPPELGGGVSHSMMCDMLRTLAGYCGSTALANSMHQHLLGANIWKFLRGQGGEPMLRKVAEKQPVLVSTGARDWLESNGEMIRAEGGYRLKAMKFFASQSEIGDILVTSAPYKDPEKGWEVLHFTVPMKSDGVSLPEKDQQQLLGEFVLSSAEPTL